MGVKRVFVNEPDQATRRFQRYMSFDWILEEGRVESTQLPQRIIIDYGIVGVNVQASLGSSPVSTLMAEQTFESFARCVLVVPHYTERCPTCVLIDAWSMFSAWMVDTILIYLTKMKFKCACSFSPNAHSLPAQGLSLYAIEQASNTLS